MGVEGREKQKILEAGALALSGQLGATVQRLRKAYNLSLSELSQQSGVAKSIISQIERNETNPTLATIWRLAQALDVLCLTTANVDLQLLVGSKQWNGCSVMNFLPIQAAYWNLRPISEDRLNVFQFVLGCLRFLLLAQKK